MNKVDHKNITDFFDGPDNMTELIDNRGRVWIFEWSDYTGAGFWLKKEGDKNIEDFAPIEVMKAAEQWLKNALNKDVKLAPDNEPWDDPQ